MQNTHRKKIMKVKYTHWLLVTLLISGCASIGTAQFEKQFGKAEPRERVVSSLTSGDIDYWSEVKPIVDSRCVACHGCYDAPCQLKMSSIEGIDRGANPHKIYNPARIHAADPTRLFVDAHSVAQWRGKGFHPILNEYSDTLDANKQASVMYRILELKEQNPLPEVEVLPTKFDLALSRKQICTSAENFDDYASKHPLWGMPYALPGLTAEDQNILMRWIEEGGVYTARPPLSAGYTAQINRWEEFLNGDSLKQQLVSRYIYEHLSYAHLYFPAVEEQHFFELVRSTTPPGQVINIIPARRPYDTVTNDRFYYRFQEYVSTIVDKTHMPYALDEQRMQRWQSLFIDADYKVTALPPYGTVQGSNPFTTFKELPVTSRYKFLLDEAQFTIMAFIKGPVCRGEIALDVIDDNFWVFFVDPDQPHTKKLEEFLTQGDNARSLRLPASSGDIYRPIHQWHEYAAQQTEFLTKKDQFMADNFGGPGAITLDGLWYGNGENQNAALTVFRHFDNATVEKGLLGQSPKTSWVIDYSLLERIHYLLVAGYDVYGNLGHQLDTRLYMDFLRMEGEANFLLLLPEVARIKERDHWYRGAKEELKAYVSSPLFEKSSEPDIDYLTDDPKQELFAKLRDRFADVLPTKHDMASVQDTTIRAELERLNKLVGKPATILPENAMLQVKTRSGDEFFTLLRNTAYASMSAVFDEKKNRLPAEDTLTVLPGFIGAYPNAYFVIDEHRLNDFVEKVSNLETESDYAHVVDLYGIRRTNRDFWAHSDDFLAGYRKLSPVTFGILDYNRLENR